MVVASISACTPESSSIETSTEPQASNYGYDRISPAGKNVKVNAGISTPGGESALFNLEMWFSEIERGNAAIDLLRKNNAEIPPAPDDFDYIVGKVNAHFAYVPLPTRWFENYGLILTIQLFEAYPVDGSAYPPASIDPPNPPFDFTLHDGDTLDGWVVFQVPKIDIKPIMRFRYLYTEAMVPDVQQVIFWFKLY